MALLTDFGSHPGTAAARYALISKLKACRNVRHWPAIRPTVHCFSRSASLSPLGKDGQPCSPGAERDRSARSVNPEGEAAAEPAKLAADRELSAAGELRGDAEVGAGRPAREYRRDR